MRRLPPALSDGDEFAKRLAGKRPAVFLDHGGTLTLIVDRPEHALISDSMREAVRWLAARCTVCVVSGRDREVVQELMGVDDLVVAGSHGFDIWSPEGGTIEPDRPAIDAVMEAVLAEHPDELRVTPGKMVHEIQPKLDWDKGRAVLYPLEALGLDGDDVMPLYLGDDITDEDAFNALAARGIGIFVGDGDDPDLAERSTAAAFALGSPEEVERFLDGLARGDR